MDAAGDYGPKGASHQLTRGTLIRDIFVTTEKGWHRVRHDKLLPKTEYDSGSCQADLGYEPLESFAILRSE